MDRVYIEERAPRQFGGAGRPDVGWKSKSWYGKRCPSDSDYDLRGREQIRYRVPKGYSVRHWDSSEKPIVVGATVFDSNSFGKWMFDWSVRLFGSASRAADVAGELWLGLIRLSGKLFALEAVRSCGRDESRVRGDGVALWDYIVSLIGSCQDATDRCIRRDKRFWDSEAVASHFVRQFFRVRGRMDAVVQFLRMLERWEMRFVDVCGSYIRLVCPWITVLGFDASSWQVTSRRKSELLFILVIVLCVFFLKFRGHGNEK